MSNKVILILIAYFFSDSQYNLFNKAYYTASIIILFGTLGFDFAVNNTKVSVKAVSIAVLINIIAAIIGLYLFTVPFTNYYQLLSVLVYSFFVSLGGIFSFQHLFNGRLKNYITLMVLNSLLHLSIIPFITILRADIFYLFPLISFVWFLIGFPGFIKNNQTNSTHFVELYKFGISTFIINSAVSFALVADKYLINHNFVIGTANAYTFSWGLIVPMLYLGNVVEKLIYSSTSGKTIQLFRKSFMILLALVILYSLSVTAVVNFIPSVLPKSVDHLLLKQIFNFMIVGYAVFVVLNFPVTGYLFKFAETFKQKITASAYITAIFLFILVFLIINQETAITNYHTLLLVVWSFIFLLLFIKTVIVFMPEKWWMKNEF